MINMQKTWLYIDGYNFYYAIKVNDELPVFLAWCDFRQLAEKHLVGESAYLDRIKYFTAPVKKYGAHGEKERQHIWLEAIKTIDKLEVIKGFYVQYEDKPREEKQTDVNIAVELLLDAMDVEGYDVAILITGDIDLEPAVNAVCNRLENGKTIRVWIPPNMNYGRWQQHAKIHDFSCDQITAQMLLDSRLPDEIKLESGILECPAQWKMPKGFELLKLL
ncbi:MAG: NYN domain-containing protein [bacterium]|nr:NYN domain-containing protein [bacterium]